MTHGLHYARRLIPQLSHVFILFLCVHRAIIEPTMAPLWDRLLPHMTRLVEQNVLAVDEAAKIFGNLLLKEDSKCRQRVSFQRFNIKTIGS